jgi:hypothetical protein
VSAPGELRPGRLDGRPAAARELARLLGAGACCPVERGGATALLAAIAGQRALAADVAVRQARDATQEERDLLAWPRLSDLHRREGLLRTSSGLPVALVTALVVTSRVPPPARPALGVTPAGLLACGAPPRQARSQAPLGRAVSGCAVSREQLAVAVTPGCLDEAGDEVALRSCARLWLPSGWPLAVVTERVYAGFLDAFPLPWKQAS